MVAPTVIKKPIYLTEYDPTALGLEAQCDDDWGNPVENRRNLVPYGIREIDKALYGLDTMNGELNLILGQEKQRKTTFAINIVINYMTSEKPEIKPMTVIDALESGMNPKRYRDTILSNLATRILLAQGHTIGRQCPKCGTPLCQCLGLSPEFLRYKTRNQAQEEAIAMARHTFKQWPLHIYGANPVQGDTRNLKAAIREKDARWRYLVHEFGAKIFVIDHVQQYSLEQIDATDYEKQIRAVGAVGDIVAQESVVTMMLSQVSLTSVRAQKEGSGRISAAGGQKGAQEANVVFSTSYTPGSGQMRIAIDESRKSGTFAMVQPIEDTSGAFYGDAKPASVSLEE